MSLLRPNPRTILIEGAPGGGKSTLALHICHQWAQGAFWLARFDIVVLAYMRDKGIQNATTLADILPAQISQSQTIVPQIQASYGKGVLFIFDGWDEFPSNLMNKSLASNIIRQPESLSLHRSTVLITTRPVSSGNLLHLADRRVEILGFTQHQIREYFEKALDGNSTCIQKLIQHIEKHPVIEGCCYIPLHSAILVHIFLTMKGALPTTLHELFCSLVLCCIVREQATHEPDTSLPELFSLDDLPDELKSKLSNLSILAYNGVLQDRIVFYSKDLEMSRLPSDLPSLGLLQAVEGLTLYSTSRSYNFLHLSVQELLAAYCISQMDPSEQIRVFTELIRSSRFHAVLHYYSGFTKLDNPEIQKFISCYQHEKSSFVELLPLLHCFFEAQQPSLCQLISSKFIPNEFVKLNSQQLMPVDFMAIGYFINSLLSTSNIPTIHISVVGINDQCLKLLLIELSKYTVREMVMAAGALPGKLAFCLDHTIITEQVAKQIASHLKSSPIIRELSLCNSKIDENGFLRIVKALQTRLSLTKLNLRYTDLQYTGKTGSVLTKMLKFNTSLTHLDLSSSKLLSDNVAHRIFKCLQHNATLVNLNLSNTGITATDPDTVRSLTKMLQVNKSLTHLDLSYLDISLLSDNAHITFISHIFHGLECNNTLLQLNLRHLEITDIDAKYIAQALMRNHSLQTLDIVCFISNDGIYDVFESLMLKVAGTCSI